MQEHKIYKSIIKILKYLFIGISLLFLFIFLLFFVITQLYSDQLKEMAFDQINANLNTEFIAKDVDVSLIDQFPNISITFSDVIIMDPYKEKDTLLYSKKLFLKFNALDFLKRNYSINSIVLNNGLIKAKVNKGGQENYFIINNTDTTKNSQFSFVLDQVSLDNFQIEYLNVISEQSYSFNTENIIFSGDFNEKIFKMNLDSRMTVNSFNAQGIEYINNKYAEIDLELLVNNDSSFISINRGNLKVADMKFNIVGNLNSNENDKIQLIINGDNIQLSQIFSVFPIDYLSVLKKYRSSGELEFNAKISGDLSINKPLKFSSSFNIQNGSFIALNNNVSLEKLNLKGDFDNYKGKLSINSFSGYMGDQSIDGSFSIQEFKNPLINCKIKGGIDFEKLSKFSTNLGSEISGNGDLLLDAILKFENNKVKIRKALGELRANNISINSKNLKVELSNLFMNTINNNLVFEKLDGKFNESNLQGKVIFYDWIKTLFEQNQAFKIDSELNIDKIDIGELINAFSSNTSTNKLEYNLTSKINVKEAKIEKFKATSVSSKWMINSKSIYCEKLLFNGQGGDYEITGDLNQTKKKLKVNAKLNNVKVDKLFNDLENFNQNLLTHNQIKGDLNLDLNFDAQILLNNEIDYNNMKVKSDIKFKGILINHPFLKDLLDYFNSNTLTKNFVDYNFFNKKIKKVVFEEINSQVIIEKEKVSIPKTYLENNVLNMNVSGWQSFKDSIDYHLSFNWRDLRRGKTKGNEFGQVKDDGLGNQLYLNIKGTLDNPIYKLDQSEKKEIRKEKIQKEKEQIKKIISGQNNSDEEVDSKPIFEVEWEEDVDTTLINEKETEEKPKQKPKDSTKINKWLKKLGVEEKEKKKPVFKIEN
ncbi:MAG: hypothetical protein CL846_03800 [Crocinitomicaceae bacterium]|nr:hypothetical protein [Crocinitomicaceae bacterium]